VIGFSNSGLSRSGRIGLDRIDITQVSIILLVLFEFDNQTTRSIKTKLLEVPKSNFWSSLLRLLHLENPVANRVINNISTEFSIRAIFTPFRNNPTAMGKVMELRYPVILNAVQGKKRQKQHLIMVIFCGCCMKLNQKLKLKK